MGYIAKKGDIVLFGVEETAYGTMSASITRIAGEIESFTPPTYDRKVSVGHQLSTTSPSSYREDVQDYTGGKIDVVFRRGDILEYVVGAAVDDPVGSAHDHTVTPDDIPGSLSIALGGYDTKGVIVLREVYLGSVISSLSLTCKKGQNLKMSIGFECAKVTTDTTAIVADYFTDEPILFKGSSLTLTPAVGSSSTITTITDFTWNFNREISKATELNSLLPAHKTAGNWDSDCSFSFYVIDQNENDLFHGAAGGSQDAPADEYVINFTCTNGLATSSERTVVIRGSSSKLGKFTYGDDGGFRTGTITGILKSVDLVLTDATANWDA